jgi:hypothetical protein
VSVGWASVAGMSISAAPVADLGGTPPGRPAWALTGDQLLAELDELHRAVASLQTRRLEVLARFDELGHAKELGARDAAELLALRHRLDRGAVRRDLRLAAALPKYAAVSSSLLGHSATSGLDDDGPGDHGADDGADDRGGVTVHPVQAEVIVSALERVPGTVPAEDVEVAERALVAAARTLAPRDLRRLAEAAVDRLDPDGPEPDEQKARDLRRLYLSRGRHGVRFQGFLAAEEAELFATLIDAGSKPRKTEEGEQDPRTHGQRQADALAHILRGAAAHGDLPAHGGIRPHIAVTISLADLLDEGRHATGDPTFGDGLSASAVRMLACDAAIIPIILGSESQPLDVGQEARSITPAIRRALIARDGGCVIPGCGAPPGHCDGHHIVHWSKTARRPSTTPCSSARSTTARSTPAPGPSTSSTAGSTSPAPRGQTRTHPVVRPHAPPDRPTPDRPTPDRPTPDRPTPDRSTPDRPRADARSPTQLVMAGDCRIQ